MYATGWIPDRGQTYDDGICIRINHLSSNKELAERLAEKLWRPGDETSFTLAVHLPGNEVTLWDVDVIPTPTFDVSQRGKK